MKNPRTFTVFLLLLLLSISCSLKKKPMTAEVIDELVKKSQQVNSYVVDTKSITNMKGNSLTITGKTYWKKPDMMRMTTNMMDGSKQEVYHANGVVWTYNPMMKMAMKMDVSKMRDSSQENFNKERGPASLLQNFPKESMTLSAKQIVDGNEVYVFAVSPEQAVASPQQNMAVVPHALEIMIYADTGLPYKLTMRDKDDALLMEQSYTNYQVNVSIPDSDFEFIPPKDIKVMDMGGAKTNMMEKMND